MGKWNSLPKKLLRLEAIEDFRTNINRVLNGKNTEGTEAIELRYRSAII